METKEEQARSHPLFATFWEWAEENGCDSEHFADWEAWWDCYLAGAIAFANRG